MVVLIRTEAGQEIGFGHLVRSLSVAKKIREIDPGAKIVFLIPDNAQAIHKLVDNNFEYCLTNNQSEETLLIDGQDNCHPDVIFVDKLFNYSTDFINHLRQKSNVILLNNYCEGAYSCDSYIFPSAHTAASLLDDERWQTSKTKVFEGFDYVILNEDILKITRFKEHPGLMKIVVITTGGSDPLGVMIKLIEWLNDENLENVQVWALIGEAFCHRKTLTEISGSLNSHIHLLDYDPDVFCDADLAISTFGQSTYELLFLGIPVLSIGHIRQNALGSHILSKKSDLLTDLGYINDLSKETFLSAWRKAINDNRVKTSYRPLIDGRGAKRIADIVVQMGRGTL